MMQYRVMMLCLIVDMFYFYVVMVDGEVVGGGVSFRTVGIGPFKFLVIGDSGCGFLAQLRVVICFSLEFVLFLIHVGDIAYENGIHAEF